MVDVFVSYKREERARCERIAQKLKALNLDVWFDARLESGKSFDREIEEKIASAKAVLVLWSPAAVNSDWVRAEAGIGKDQDKLAAVQIEPCTLPIAFHTTHYELLTDPDFPDHDPAWLKTLGRIGRLTGKRELQFFADAIENLRAETAQKKAKAPLLAIALSALIAAGAGGAAAWLLKPPPPPVSTARTVALDMVGRWNEVGLGNCSDSALNVSIEPGGIALSFGSAREARAIVALQEGWLQLGDGSSLQRKGDNLMIRTNAGLTPTEYTPCS